MQRPMPKSSVPKKGCVFAGSPRWSCRRIISPCLQPPARGSARPFWKRRAEIQILAQRIQRGENFPAVPGSAKDKLLSGPVNTLFYQFAVTDKGFTVSDSCISCGKCAQRCPLGNIGIASGKPVWKGNCTHCMACIAGCPTQAIEYKSKSKGQHRHYIMED